MMDSAIDERPTQIIHTYPKMMKHKRLGFVVFMTAQRAGVVVYSPSDKVYHLGYGESLWDLSNLVDFHGTVTLSQ